MATLRSRFILNRILQSFHKAPKRAQTCVRPSQVNGHSYGIEASRGFSTEASQDRRSHVVFRTSEENPVNHSWHHTGLFYTVDPVYRTLYSTGNRPQFLRSIKPFNELAVMVRKPVIEVSEIMKRANYDLPCIRYGLYGEDGCGKTVSLSHIIHRCAAGDWLVVHFPFVPHITKSDKRGVFNINDPSIVDQPAIAQTWLKQFLEINAVVLGKIKPVTQTTYAWSKKDVIEKGSAWNKLVVFAQEKEKLACQIVDALLAEVKEAANRKEMRLLVAIDGLNAVFEEITLICNPQKVQLKLKPDELSLIRSIKSTLDGWTNGAVVFTLDAKASLTNKESDLPISILGRKGFEELNPFIPVEVPAYSEIEALNHLEYLADRKFITHPFALSPKGKKELMFLSEKNPKALFNCTLRW